MMHVSGKLVITFECLFFRRLWPFTFITVLKTYLSILSCRFMSLCILMIANVRLSMKALDLTQKSLTCMSSLRLASVFIRVEITIVLILTSITLCYNDNLFLFRPNMNLVTWYDKMKIMEP